MNTNWITYNDSALGLEFPFPCKIEEFIKGDGRFTEDKYVVKMETICNIVPKSAEDSDFAESAQYIVSIPYPDESPILYVDDRITITTPNEEIITKIERTMPVSLFKKMQVYVERTTWNTRPEE